MEKSDAGDVFLTAFSPRPLPHRFLFRPRFSFCAAESRTLRTTKEKRQQNNRQLRRLLHSFFFFSVTFGKRPYSSSFVKCCYPKEIVTKIPKEVVTVPACQQFENLFTRFESPCPASAKQIAFSRENIKRYVRHFQKKS